MDVDFEGPFAIGTMPTGYIVLTIKFLWYICTTMIVDNTLSLSPLHECILDSIYASSALIVSGLTLSNHSIPLRVSQQSLMANCSMQDYQALYC